MVVKSLRFLYYFLIPHPLPPPTPASISLHPKLQLSPTVHPALTMPCSPLLVLPGTNLQFPQCINHPPCSMCYAFQKGAKPSTRELITMEELQVPQEAYEKDYFGRTSGERSLWSTLSKSTQGRGKAGWRGETQVASVHGTALAPRVREVIQVTHFLWTVSWSIQHGDICFCKFTEKIKREFVRDDM